MEATVFSSYADLASAMRSAGATQLYAKRLAANDNSKNQIYLGGSFLALNVIPHGSIWQDPRSVAGSKRQRLKAAVSFRWLTQGGPQPAPHAQLILYPKYPEVRLSGLLLGCPGAPRRLIASRDPGRVLFFGTTAKGVVLGYAVGADDPVAKEMDAMPDCEALGVFQRLPWVGWTSRAEERVALLAKLAEVASAGWIASKKLDSNGEPQPYRAMNGGGFTLEAELGVMPNSVAGPDLHGWEVKQYGVQDFVSYRPKSSVTLFTPQPTAGEYVDAGVRDFVNKYGYPDQRGRPDRRNFGGLYVVGKKAHTLTGLRLALDGYDEEAGKIVDVDGGIVLLNKIGEVAAKWGFVGLMEHWKRKHERAVYVPSLVRRRPPAYRYASRVELHQHTEFGLFLRAMARGKVVYDPAVKMEHASWANPKIKHRSQFRVKHGDLGALYELSEIVDVAVDA